MKCLETAKWLDDSTHSGGRVGRTRAATTADLLSLQRYPLRPLWTLLLENGTRHLALPVDLELEDRPARILEARFRSCDERRLGI